MLAAGGVNNAERSMLRPGESDLTLRAIPRRPAGWWLGTVGVGDHLVIYDSATQVFPDFLVLRVM